MHAPSIPSSPSILRAFSPRRGLTNGHLMTVFCWATPRRISLPPPEERLFPVVDDLLDSWMAEYVPEDKGLRLVGHQWSARSHAAGQSAPRTEMSYERR